jgi:hypothetical protein
VTDRQQAPGGTDRALAFGSPRADPANATVVVPVDVRGEASTVIDEGEQMPPGERPTVLTWKRPDKT